MKQRLGPGWLEGWVKGKAQKTWLKCSFAQ